MTRANDIADRIITVVAPRGWFDFGIKTLLLTLLIGGMNFIRDLIEDPADADSLLRNTVDAGFVGLPFCLLALYLFWRLKHLQDELISLATKDMLTGLDNRRAFYDKAGAMLPNPGGTLLMIDVDHFKRVNDTFGHAMGDLCLQAVADHLRKEQRNEDVVARLGGEEFVLLLAGADAASARQIGARLVRGVQLPAQLSADHPELTLSIGAVSLTGCAQLEDGLRAADAALYAAKNAGRARMEMVSDTILAA